MAFFGLFRDVFDVLDAFAEPASTLDGCTIVFAFYELDGYEGSALVLFERDGQLYEVNGDHCSCFGLEAQWDPEPCDARELEQRPVQMPPDAAACLAAVLSRYATTP